MLSQHTGQGENKTLCILDLFYDTKNRLVISTVSFLFVWLAKFLVSSTLSSVVDTGTWQVLGAMMLQYAVHYVIKFSSQVTSQQVQVTIACPEHKGRTAEEVKCAW
jgi:hypothetical protein